MALVLEEVYIVLSPLPVTVTTRIITFLVGDPYKPSFATVTGRGDNPNDGDDDDDDDVFCSLLPCFPIKEADPKKTTRICCEVLASPTVPIGGGRVSKCS